MADQPEAQLGQDNLPADSLVNVYNHYGDMVAIDSKNLSKALASGSYKLPTPEQSKSYQLEQQYGTGIAEPVKAFTEAAGSAYSLGTSRMAEKAAGVSPEAMQAREEYNPIASTLGTGAGVLASLLPVGAVVGAGAKALGAGAKAARILGDMVNPVAAIGKAGAATAELAAPLAAKGAGLIAGEATSPILNKILAKGLSGAAGSAVEGAAFGAGNLVDESALGDPDLNAEKIASHIGASALFGAGLGGLFGAGKVAVPESIQKGKDAISNLYSKVIGVEGEVGPGLKPLIKASSLVSGKPEEIISDALAKRKLSLTTPSENLHLAEDFGKNLNQVHDEVGDAYKKAFKEIRPEENRAILNSMNEDVALKQFDGAYQRVNETLDTMAERPERYPGWLKSKLEDIRDGFSKSIPATAKPAEIFDSINSLKQDIDKGIKFGREIAPELQDSHSAMMSLRSDLKGMLENEDVWGQAGARQSAFNDSFNEFNTTQKEFRKKFMYKTQGKSGGVDYKIDPSKVNSYFRDIGTAKGNQKTEILQDYLDASQKSLDEVGKTYEATPHRVFNKDAVQSVLEKNQKVAQQAVEQANFNKKMNILSGGAHNVPLAEGAAMAAGVFGHPVLGAGVEAWNMLKAPNLVVQRLAKIERAAQDISNKITRSSKAIFSGVLGAGEQASGFIGAKMVPKENQKPAMPKAMDRVAQLTADPEQMMDHLEKTTQNLYHAAPNISSSVQKNIATSMNFLKSKMPVQPDSMPLSAKHEDSPSDIAKFNRYYEAVNDPVGVLKHVADGTVGTEEMETLKTVYPKLYQEMQSEVMDKLMDYKGKKNNEPIPYRTRLSLAMFLGQDLEHSTLPQNIQANQMAISANKVKNALENPGMTKPSQAGLKNLSVSARASTPLRDSMNREDV